MKKSIIFSLVAVLFISAATTSSARSTSPLLDHEQSEDHYAIWRMDSTNEVNFTTYDLAAMEVRGHAKHVIVDQTIATFDEDGIMTSYKDEISDFQLDHNEDGYLTTYAVGAGSSTYSIDPEKEVLVCFSGGEGSSSWTHWYKYDNKNNLKEIEYNFEDEADNEKESHTMKVKDLKRDAHGNWIERMIGDATTSRTIVYYPNPLGDEEPSIAPYSKEFNPLSAGYSFSGTIGGDKNALLTFVGGKGTYDISYGRRIIEVESYDKATGKLIIRAYMKKGGPVIGRFNGTYKNGSYSGIFTNTKGGKVNFNLKMMQ